MDGLIVNSLAGEKSHKLAAMLLHQSKKAYFVSPNHR